MVLGLIHKGITKEVGEDSHEIINVGKYEGWTYIGIGIHYWQVFI